jgi:beta-lactamase regulating signal transducer with metallopeptidase domain
MTAAFNFDGMVQASAIQIVECLVEGTFIAIFAGLALRVAKGRNSGEKFALWFSALMVIAALPLLGGLWQSHAGSVLAQEHPAITLPGSWAWYLFSAWAVVAAWSLMAVGRGVWHLRVLRKSCVEVDSTGLDPLLQATLARSQAARAVELCTSDRVHVPTAIGLMNPAIILPRWVLQELSAEELNQILLHELAHLRRWDDWTNLVQKIVRALFFFHPAVWWIERKVSLEREMACDDAVIAETAKPRAYAECLAHLAEKTLIQRSLAMAQAALGKIRQTSLRVAQILDVNRPKSSSPTWRPAAALVASFGIAVVAGVSTGPRLVAFGDRPSADGASTIARVSSDPATPSAEKVSPGAVVHASLSKENPAGQPVRWTMAKWTVPETSHNLKNSARATISQHLPSRKVMTHNSPQVTQEEVAQQNDRQTSARPAQLGAAGLRPTDVRYNGTDPTRANVTPVAFTETLLVVVEGFDNSVANQPVYQIQMWRVTVLHQAIDSGSNKVHPKQT